MLIYKKNQLFGNLPKNSIIADKYNVSSVLEQDISPLQTLLSCILLFSALTWIFNIIFLYNLFRIFLLNDNKDFILSLINKIVKNTKIKSYIETKFKYFLKVGEKFDLILLFLVFIFITISLFTIVIVCILLISDLDGFSLDHIKYHTQYTRYD